MHADQDDHHPWLGEETMWLQQLLHRHTPVLGVCLGVQLLARAAGAWVGRMPGGPELGWCAVELTDEGVDDPVLGSLPRTFEALQWHHYTYGLPAGAVELARSPACTQAFRLGDACWGVQFHPEVTATQLEGWIADDYGSAARSRRAARGDPAEDRRAGTTSGARSARRFSLRRSGCWRARLSSSGVHDPSHDRDRRMRGRRWPRRSGRANDRPLQRTGQSIVRYRRSLTGS